MEILVINLDRCPERWSEFQTVNAHLKNAERFPAVDGRTITHEVLLQRGLFEEPILYAPGPIGNALSHLRVWERAAKQPAYTTVVEDDAIVHKDFAAIAPRMIESLPADWDIALWGWNFDAVMGMDLFPGTPCALRFSQNAMREHWQSIQQATIQPAFHKLHYAFGVVSYSVSPKGALKLRKALLPLKPFYNKISALDIEVQNDAIDSALASVYSQINAFACFPPLIITKNEHAKSSVMQDVPENAEASLLMQPSDFTSSRKYKRKYARYLFAKGDIGGGVRWYLKYLTAGRDK